MRGFFKSLRHQLSCGIVDTVMQLTPIYTENSPRDAIRLRDVPFQTHAEDAISPSSPAPAGDPQTAADAQRIRRRKIFHATAIVALVAQLAFLGLLLRVWTFSYTAPIRFQGDLDNAWNKGTQALQIGPGYWSGIVKMYQPKRHTGIDYPPIRMYIKTAWVMLCHKLYGPAVQRTDADTWPMLTVNYIMELAGAVGMYFLCRLRCNRALSLLAACCLWFNPGVIINSFAWTQWDVWVVAPAVWAMWAYLTRRYFLAGAFLGLGAMMKGQALFAAPWFLLMAVFEPGFYSIKEKLSLRRLPLRLQRGAERLFTWYVSAIYRFRAMLAGMFLVVFIAILPFTLRGTYNWFQVYHHQAHIYQPMSVGAANFPLILAAHYGWWNSQAVWTLPLPGYPLSYSIMTWLTVIFAGWAVIITVLSARARHTAMVLLGPGLIFAAMDATLPGMHERYPIYAAALLAPAVCIGPGCAFLYLLVSALALSSPLRTMLGADANFAPKLQWFLDVSMINTSWLWIFCAVALTYRTYFIRRRVPAGQLAAAHGPDDAPDHGIVYTVRPVANSNSGLTPSAFGPSGNLQDTAEIPAADAADNRNTGGISNGPRISVPRRWLRWHKAAQP